MYQSGGCICVCSLASLSLVVVIFVVVVVRLHLVTWNVGTASPPPDVTSLLQLNLQGLAVDVYIVG